MLHYKLTTVMCDNHGGLHVSVLTLTCAALYLPSTGEYAEFDDDNNRFSDDEHPIEEETPDYTTSGFLKKKFSPGMQGRLALVTKRDGKCHRH
jgi:hypothetical protein